MSEGASDIREGKKRGKLYILQADKALGSPTLSLRLGEEKDEVDKVLEDIVRRKAQKLKSLELEKFLLETQREVEKMRSEVEKGSESSESPSSNGEAEASEITPMIAVELAKLPEDQRRTVMQTYSMLKGIEKSDSRTLPLILPMLIERARANSASNGSNVTDVVRAMADVLKTGFDMGKSQSQGSQTGDQLVGTLLNALLNHLMKEKDEETKQLLAQVYEALGKKENIFEKILTDESFRENLRSFFSREGTPPELNAEIAKMRVDLEKFKAEQGLALDKWKAEKDWEIKRQENLVRTLETIFQGPPGRIIDSAVSKVVGGIGKGVAAQAATQAAKMITAKCGECGAIFQIAEGLKTVKCPSCGAELEIPTT
jgi:ribosomal protein S27E